MKKKRKSRLGWPTEAAVYPQQKNMCLMEWTAVVRLSETTLMCRGRWLRTMCGVYRDGGDHYHFFYNLNSTVRRRTDRHAFTSSCSADTLTHFTASGSGMEDVLMCSLGYVPTAALGLLSIRHSRRVGPISWDGKKNLYSMTLRWTSSKWRRRLWGGGGQWTYS